MKDRSRRTFLQALSTALPALRFMAEPIKRGGEIHGIQPNSAQRVEVQGSNVAHLNGLELVIDEQTGCLTNISYSSVGAILEASLPSAGLLDVAYPIESFTPMRLASRFSKASLVKENKGIRIIWEALGASRRSFPLPLGRVSAEVRINAADDGRSVSMACRIQNMSANPVPQILFPDLQGLRPFDGTEETKLRLARDVVQPFNSPVRDVDSAPPYYMTGWSEFPAGGYYVANALRWLDYGSLRGGLSIFQRKWRTADRPNILTSRRGADRMQLRLAWEHRTTIEPGQTWHSGEFWLTPHHGGWAKGIEVYRQYVEKVNPPREIPSHVREGLGFRSVWMAQALDHDPAKVYFHYKDLPEVARDAAEHGIDEMVPWEAFGYSPPLPPPLRPELGTIEEFLDGIREAKKLGVNVAPFVSVVTVLAQYAKRYRAILGPGDNWTYDSEFVPRFRPYYSKAWAGAIVDTDNKIWKQDLVAGLEEWLDRGLFSFSFDQFRDNRSSTGNVPDLVALVEKVRSLARVKDAQSTFSSESLTSWSMEWDGSVLDYTWNWVDYVDASPILSVLRAPRLNCNVDASPRVVKKGFCDGLYLNVMPSQPGEANGTALMRDRPQLAAALKQVSKLRRQFLPFFTTGIFLGDSMLSKSASTFVRGHLLDNRLLAIVLNDQIEPGYVTVQSDLGIWLPAVNDYRVSYYDKDGNLIEAYRHKDPHWTGITRFLQPLELAFFEIEARNH